MNNSDYYLIDSVVVRYASGSETLNSLNIIRSKNPRRIGKLESGQTVEDWINENEELSERIIYESGVWNVKEWESAFYISEIADYGIDVNDIESVKRVVHYMIPKFQTIN